MMQRAKWGILSGIIFLVVVFVVININACSVPRAVQSEEQQEPQGKSGVILPETLAEGKAVEEELQIIDPQEYANGKVVCYDRPEQGSVIYYETLLTALQDRDTDNALFPVVFCICIPADYEDS
ncbi:hypothetical protein LJC56_08185 [Christensenellaceae bacterium OttesenSCG-928-K19]|nr:hypothetical protein [Christensenellaceae bacterium OttesenSCG-928-K19]